MNNFKKAIVLFDSSKINDVRNCLAECQYYHETVAQNILDKTNKNPMTFTDTLMLLSGIKDKKVTFYFLKSKDCTYIYSDFFNLQDSLKTIIPSFENLNTTLFLCELEKEKIIFSTCIKGIIQHCCAIQIKNNLNIEFDFICTTSELEKKTVAQVISFIASKYKLSNREINNYLNSYSIFKDEYII